MGKVREKIEWAEKLSLGISVVVAILLGVGLGIWLKNLFGQWWWVLIGSFWGVAAAYQNLKRAYLKVKKELDEEAKKYREYQFNRGDLSHQNSPGQQNSPGGKGDHPSSPGKNYPGETPSGKNYPGKNYPVDEEDDLSQFEK